MHNNVTSLDFSLENKIISTSEDFLDAFQEGLNDGFHSLGWVLRKGMMEGYIQRKDFCKYFSMISAVDGQKAGWALDNAIMQGWINDEETFFKYFSMISAVDGQKAGWALDNAIMQGWIDDEETFFKYFSMISEITDQKICFPIHHGMERGWFLDKEHLIDTLQRELRTSGQGIGWALRQSIRKNIIGEKDFLELYPILASIPGQKAGWVLDSAIEVGYVITQESFFSYFIPARDIERQHMGWALISAHRNNVITHEQLITHYQEISPIVGQHAGWVLRYMLQTGIISSKIAFQECLSSIDRIVEQDMKWTLDIALEKGYLSDIQLEEFYGHVLTIQGYNFDWVMYQFLSQGKSHILVKQNFSRKYYNVGKQAWHIIINIICEGQHLKDSIFKLISHYRDHKQIYLGVLGITLIQQSYIQTPKDFDEFFVLLSDTPSQKLGMSVKYAFSQGIISLESVQRYYYLLRNTEGQAAGYVLKDIICNIGDPHFDSIGEFKRIAPIKSQNAGIVLQALVQRQVVIKKVHAKSLFSCISKVPGQAGEHFLDVASEKGWLSKKEYQRFFSITDI